MMLEIIMGDDEFEESYLKTGVNEKKLTLDSLYMMGDNPDIDLRNCDVWGEKTYIEKNFIKEIKKEYQLVCKCERLRLERSDKYKKKPKENEYLIRPYAINLALLFELYSRWYVKNNMKSFAVEGARLLNYISDKTKKKFDEEKEGAKLICKPIDASQDDSKSEKNDAESKDKQKTDDNEENIFYLDGIVVPDIVIWDEEKKEYYIYDVKYKDPTDKNDRDDRLQILAYAFMYNAKRIGHIFPDNGFNQHKDEPFEVDSENNVEYKMKYISAISEPNPPH